MKLTGQVVGYFLARSSSGVVGRGGDLAAVAGPVRVHKVARCAEQLVGVRAKVVTLRLD